MQYNEKWKALPQQNVVYINLLVIVNNVFKPMVALLPWGLLEQDENV